jgi:indolepyruvate ferredoxin oxidoreductase beta subunit
MIRPMNVMLVGVGGQGIILASEVLCHALLGAGWQVKKSEVHGMAQRGGSVRTDVRFGTEVHAPLISVGAADILVAFEQLEALRYAHFLRPQGLVLLSTERITPVTVLTGPYPYPADVPARLDNLGVQAQGINAPELAARAGNPRTAGIALVGALSKHLPVPAPKWGKAITGLVPERYREVNLDAFRRGRRLPARALAT